MGTRNGTGLDDPDSDISLSDTAQGGGFLAQLGQILAALFAEEHVQGTVEEEGEAADEELRDSTYDEEDGDDGPPAPPRNGAPAWPIAPDRDDGDGDGPGLAAEDTRTDT
jgi:hypothetical protein